MTEARLDEVGPWSEMKLEIIREYSSAYVQIMRKHPEIRQFSYVDGFAGAGTHLSKRSGKEIEGSPAIALTFPFSNYHFIDLDGKRTARLRDIAAGRDNVTVHQGDCNTVLLDEVFPTCRYEDYRRALCLLDPYGLNPNWAVVQTAGRMRSIEIFLNFMIMDANMNVLRKNPDEVAPDQIERMNLFWGDNSWRDAGYKKQPTLFGDVDVKLTNEAIVAAYQARLRDVAGFRYVPDPVPMKNSTGAVVYYLFFASQNAAGYNIARDIFKKYREGLLDEH